jgi:hypothetical protein
VPARPSFVESLVVRDLPQIPGLVAAIGQFDEASKRHALLVAYDPATAPIGVDIDLATVEDVKVGVGYDIDPLQKIRSSYRVVAGTLRLTEACAGGVSGTLRAAALGEVDLFQELAPVPNGCTMALPETEFQLAATCDPGPSPDPSPEPSP